MSDTTQELIKTALPYFEAEAAIARRFFDSSPSMGAHEHWLRAQLWKELHPVDGYFSGLASELKSLGDMVASVDKIIPREHFAFLLRQMEEEFNHYILIAGLLEMVLGRKVTPDDGVQLPEERRLEELRRLFSTSGSPIKKAAVLL